MLRFSRPIGAQQEEPQSRRVLVHFTRCVVNGLVGKAQLNERTGDEQAYTMRQDADGQPDGLVYDDWVKCSPQNTLLRGIVKGPSCPADSMFQ
jgi:hypothetical protein